MNNIAKRLMGKLMFCNYPFICDLEAHCLKHTYTDDSYWEADFRKDDYFNFYCYLNGRNLFPKHKADINQVLKIIREIDEEWLPF